MSTWNLGADDVSEETQAFRNKLSSKDAHIAAQQDKLVKQAEELQEIKDALNDALHKLSDESARVLKLESDLQHRTEELRNEKIATQNVHTTLNTAHTRAKNNSLDMRELQATLEKISHTSDEHNARGIKLEREKSMLEVRVRELEANLRDATSGPAPTPGRRIVTRHRSSSLSNFRITTLEEDLVEARTTLAKKDIELQTANHRLGEVQNALIKMENDSAATERRLKAELTELHATLEEKDEELLYLRDQQGDGSREEELLRRIEEDDAKISALEMMLRGSEDSKALRDKLRRMEAQCKEEQRRVLHSEDRCVEIAREKEEVLDELEDARNELAHLAKQLQDKEARDHSFNARALKALKGCDDPLMTDETCLIDMNVLEPQPLSPQRTPTTHSVLDDDTIVYIERLLLAIARLREERNGLRRDVHFLESESRFAIEALEARLSASFSTASQGTTSTMHQLKAEMDELHSKMAKSREEQLVVLHAKNVEIRRLGRIAEASAIALRHVVPQVDINEARANQAEDTVKELKDKLNTTSLSLEHVTDERDRLASQIQSRDLEEVGMAKAERHDGVEELLRQISELNEHLEDIESERDSLILQVTNLTTDLQIAQDELSNAESRYTSLQFHQLSSMTSSEATRTLRDHIGELEARVMRRTEQIGVHQHDIRRLETNLVMQEERLSEMTTELEMMAAQKDAMVEDCADAREARDEALARVEALEVEVENLEIRDFDNEVIITTLIATIAETVCQTRETLRVVKQDARHLEQRYNATQRLLDEKEGKLVELARHSNERQEQLQQTAVALATSQLGARKASTLAHALTQEKSLLQSQLATAQARNYEATISKLQHDNQELQGRLRERELAGANNEDAERDLVQLRLQHAEAMGALQSRLIETQSTLEELETSFVSAQEEHQRAIAEANDLAESLERRLEAANKNGSELDRLRERYDGLEEHSKAHLAQLQDELLQAAQDFENVRRSCDTLRGEKERLIESMARMEQDHAALLTRSLDEHYSSQRELEKRISTLQARAEEHARLLEISKEEASRLSTRLREEAEGRGQERAQHAMSLSSATGNIQRLEDALSHSQEDLATLQDELEQTRAQASYAEEERDRLQRETTNLEAEIQRSKSMNRYLESQVNDGKNVAETLKADLERAHADQARAEKAWKATEVNFSLSNAQHKREMSEIQREISAYRSRPNLEQALAELEERNNEMEELLRAKCAEIEENDDRALEMMKEKKKLTTKVESLTRKMQNLQAKLTAAKAASNALPPSPDSLPSLPPLPQQDISQARSTPLSRPRSVTMASTTTVPSVPFDPPVRNPSNRVVSGPSSLPRPKTPERKRTITPVFKARTPERRINPEAESVPSTTVIGKKRSAPDDFGSYNSIPAQAFTPDGQIDENRTPRTRKELQSGFTPIRNSRPTVGMPSPRRSAATRSPFISDLTNSPRLTTLLNPAPSAKQSKRSWLGKIRGSSQVVDTSRSIFRSEAS